MTYSTLQSIGSAIVSGEYGCEGVLPSQKELCKQYGVSRVVIREAIQMLTAKQMLFTRMSQGTWIRPENVWNLFDQDILAWLSQREFSPAMLREFNETRYAIEPQVASSMAKNNNDKSLETLKLGVNDIISTYRKGWDTLTVKTNFHLSLLNGCNNRFYMQFATFLKTAIEYQHLFGASSIESDSFNPALYQNIYQRVSDGDTVGAANAMKAALSTISATAQTQSVN